MNITIREASPDDASLIAEVVAMAIGEQTARLYCGDKYLDVLAETARTDNTQYSYRNALVALADGMPVGAIVGYDGAMLAELRANTLAIIHRHNPALTINDDETQPGEFYLDSLGVNASYRGHGIASALLDALATKAFTYGHSRVGLLVDYENPSAERLYTRLGFQFIDNKTFLGHKMKHLQRRPSR